MKKQIACTTYLLLLALGLTATAQEASHIEPPKTDYKSLGFQKPVKQVGIGYYKADDKGYEPKMLEVYTFNDEHQLVQKYIRIFGQYGSETVHNYTYADGKLDSISTLASAANFNSEQKLHYADNGQLAKITATGKYANYTDTYAYNGDDALASIERKHQNGTTMTANFNRAQNYVTQKTAPAQGETTESFFIYDGDKLFASFTAGQPIVTFYDTYHRADFQTELKDDQLAYALKLRDLKSADFDAFKQQISDLRGQPQSTTFFDIPVEATNMTGDWIKRLQVDRRFAEPEKRFVFKKLVYADGTESGSTDFDLIFQSRVSKF